MKAVVTGGAGFIGSNIAAALDARGDEVVVLDDLARVTRTNLAPLPEGRASIEGSILDEALVVANRDGRRGRLPPGRVGREQAVDRRPACRCADERARHAARARSLPPAGVRKIVFSSSAGIFGELKTLPIAEDHPVEPDSPYGASKLAAEKLCLAYAKLYGLEAVCLRYFNVYGPNQRFDAYGNVIPIFAFQMLRGRAAHDLRRRRADARLRQRRRRRAGEPRGRRRRASPVPSTSAAARGSPSTTW